MPYGILRFAKMKGGPARALEAHHERKKEQYASNPDVDTSRSNQNYHLIAPRQSYYYEIQNRIEKSGCKVRKDSVKFIDTIITASPEFFKNRLTEETKAFFQRTVNFISDEVGKQNIFSAVVHMDEKTPHMHLCFVPLTPDNRLSAKEVMGDRTKLSKWQDKFHECMSEVYPEMERGEPAIETKRKHLPVGLFKRATALTEQMEAIRQTMESMGAFNLAKKKEVVMEQLAQWIPKVGSFDKWIKSVQKGNQDLKKTINELSAEKENLRNEVVQGRKECYQSDMKYRNLVDDYNDIINFVNSIPQEIYDDLMAKHQDLQKTTEDLGWDMQM